MVDLIEQQFNEAVDFIRNGSGTYKASQEEQLKFYALYKQATQGDVHGKKPGLLDLVGKAKYNAWSKLKGMTEKEAKQIYIDEFRARVK